MTKPDDTVPAGPNRPEIDAFLRRVALADLDRCRGAGVTVLIGRMGGNRDRP